MDIGANCTNWNYTPGSLRMQIPQSDQDSCKEHLEMPDDPNKSVLPSGFSSSKPNPANPKIINTALRREMVKEPLDINAIDRLIEAGADINCTSNHGISLLMVVIAANNTYLFNKLLSKNVNVNHVDNKGFNALISAAVLGDNYMVKELLNAGADPLHKNQEQHRMPRIRSLSASEWARSKNHTNIVGILQTAERAALEKNDPKHTLLPQSLTQPQPVPKTAEQIASEQSESRYTLLPPSLTQPQPVVKTGVHDNRTSTISLASLRPAPQKVQHTTSPVNNAITPPIHKTASQNQSVLSDYEKQFLSALLDADHDRLAQVLMSMPSTEKDKIINKRYENGSTALMRAIEIQDEYMVKILIFHGADPMMKDSLNRTALEQALNEGDQRVINYLNTVVSNIPTNVSPDPQINPELELSLAIKLNKDLNEIKRIIQRGSLDVTKPNSKVQSYLVEAVQHNRLDVVNYLIGKRVNLDQEHNVYVPGRPSIPVPNQPKTTALIEATRLIGSTQNVEELKKTCSIINTLVDRGANIYKKDTTNKNMMDHLLPYVENHPHKAFLIEQLQRNVPILSTINQEKKGLDSSIMPKKTEAKLESPLLEEFNKKMDLFRDKIDNLQTRRDQHKPDSKDYTLLNNAVISATTLYDKLNEEKNRYIKQITPEHYEHFEKNCKEHINTARPVLDKHRGWSEFLVNLAIGVTTLGVGLLIKGAVNLANNKNFLAVHQTDSSKKLDEIEDSIQNANPRPGKN